MWQVRCDSKKILEKVEIFIFPMKSAQIEVVTRLKKIKVCSNLEKNVQIS